MKCPACSANLPDGSADCPGCGVNFEKWRTRAAEQPRTEPPKPAPETDAAESGGMFSDLPIFKIVMAGLFMAGVYFSGAAYKKYLPGGLADLAKPNYIKKDQPQAPAAAEQPAQPPTKPAPALSMTGFNTLFQEYSTRASFYSIPVKEDEAKKFFQYGVDDATGMDFDSMEAGGVTFAATPFTEEEKQLASREDFKAKCSGQKGIEYLPGLPGDNVNHTACWLRKSGRAKSSAYVQVIYSPVFPGTSWVQAQWLPNSNSWGGWTDAQQADAALVYADKYYGMAGIQDERAKTEKVVEEIMKAGPDKARFDYQLFDTFKMRFRREGLLAGADQVRRR